MGGLSFGGFRVSRGGGCRQTVEDSAGVGRGIKFLLAAPATPLAKSGAIVPIDQQAFESTGHAAGTVGKNEESGLTIPNDFHGYPDVDAKVDSITRPTAARCHVDLGRIDVRIGVIRLCVIR